MDKEIQKRISVTALLEYMKEMRSKLHDIDQKIEHIIRNLRRFNHDHLNSVDESF